MERNEKTKGTKEVSGWYAREELSPAEKEAKRQALEKWYEKKHRLNYRSAPLEIPGKMMLALGKMAMEQGVSFSEFIEAILEEYLRRKKVAWKSKVKA